MSSDRSGDESGGAGGISEEAYGTQNPSPNSFATPFALSDLLAQLEDYSPTVPDSVANSFLHEGGFETSDPRLCRLMSLAAQKFISDIINDAYTQCKLRTTVPQQGKAAKGKVDKKLTLTMEDLVPVLAEYGITVRKPQYYL